MVLLYIYYSCCLFVDICCPCESHSGTEYTNEVKLLPIHALLLFRIISYNTIVIEIAFLLKKNLKCPIFVKFFFESLTVDFAWCSGISLSINWKRPVFWTVLSFENISFRF